MQMTEDHCIHRVDVGVPLQVTERSIAHVQDDARPLEFQQVARRRRVRAGKDPEQPTTVRCTLQIMRVPVAGKAPADT